MTLSLFAASAVIKTSAAAPSFSVLALAAVTVPKKKQGTNHNKIYYNVDLSMMHGCFTLLFCTILSNYKKVAFCFHHDELFNISNGSYIITILFLENCLQFGNFAEVDPSPLLIFRHDQVRFTYKMTKTSNMFCYVK